MSDKAGSEPVFLSTLGCTNAVWINLVRQHGFELKFIPRVVYGSIITLLLTPFRVYESLRIGKAVEMTDLHDSPVFILGHWRSGTTLIHNILSVDPQFGYVSYLQGLWPHCFRQSGLMAKISSVLMPSKRPMDNMQINSNSPQEEEVALIAQSGYSVYNMWIAPDRQLEYWKRYGFLEDPEVRRRWGEGYLQLLKAATYNCAGKRLLLKNPANTVRIAYLLEKFPNAKFIYIYRDPYRVFESTKNLYRNVIPYFQLKDISEATQEHNFIRIYQEIFHAYQQSKFLIPEGSLIEVKYEEFVQDKLQGVKDIYKQLELGDFPGTEERFKEYLVSIENYKTNEFRRDEKTIGTVNAVWSFAFDEYGYTQYQSENRESQDV